MKRSNHYELAFEAYLRSRGAPYVAVDESRRSLLGDGSLKSLDFIVSPTAERKGWLIDVKGRRFPSGGRQYWRNWATEDELRSLAHWEDLFGDQFRAALVFAFHILGDKAPLPADQLFQHRDLLYGFVVVRLDHYLSFARTLSPKWGTVSMPIGRFREYGRGAEALFAG